jgi:hypothetical protein
VGECIRGENSETQGFVNCPIHTAEIVRTCKTQKQMFDELRASVGVRRRRESAVNTPNADAGHCINQAGCGCPEADMFVYDSLL